MTFARRLMLFGLLLSPLSSSLARAESDPSLPHADPNWPQKMTVTVGDIRTRVDGPKLWTLSGIDYKNTMMATEDSAYGTVVTIRNVGHLGTAHFLDAPGKPGAVEKEDVTSLKFFVNNKPVTQFTPTMELKGKSFRMERTSKIRQLDLTSSVVIKDNVLIETAHIRAAAPIDLQKAHPLMYALDSGATVYLLGGDKGILHRGVFQVKGDTTWEDIKDARWVAVYNPQTQKGTVLYVIKHPPSPEPWFLKVDAPGVYRKFAMYTLVDKIVPAGFDGTYQMAVGFFEAREKDWEKKALKRVRGLSGVGKE